jgi:adenylate cyclase
MATEIERKFLLADAGWKQAAGTGVSYRQGYLSASAERTVRVRVAGDKGFMTIKGRSSGISRSEFEYEIPLADAQTMLDTLCLKPLIEKLRYQVEFGGHLWEIDEFLGDNQGLVVAEVELQDAAESVQLPPWAGREVSDDPRYFNSNLISHPYRMWQDR